MTDPAKRTSASSWLEQAVSAFGVACRAKLAGPGDREAAIRSPLEALLTAAGAAVGVGAVFHDEVREVERRVRPDYALAIDGAIAGYVEVKAPGKGIDPERFTGHDLRQWERLRDLPNLLYTNGATWRLYRDGALHGEVVHLAGGALADAGAALAPGEGFEALLRTFLTWRPAAITNVAALVRAIAPLTRLLRGEVVDQIAAEHAAIATGAAVDDQPFLGLARDWRALLFPTGDDADFADGYAQAVTFALLLARSEGIDLTTTSLHAVGDRLHGDHSLMGTALQLLTDHVGADFTVTLSLLVRVVAAVDWPAVRSGRRDTYLHLYERFLDVYDEALRKASGSYYTPHQVVQEMVRLSEQALVRRLGRTGFADPSVTTVDPAMGTGTFLHTILERAAAAAEEQEGAGIVPGVVSDLARRLIGFEIQMGPYAVAELRATDLLHSLGARAPEGGLPLYVTNTLDNPHVEADHLASGFAPIARSRRLANAVKATTPVTVVIGNPPYRERAEGQGAWIESGDPAAGTRALLDDYRTPANGRAEYKLKNLYVYFWRWATAKVFDTSPDAPGVVCVITPASYLRGPGFAGMREYLRRTADEGWIIDLTPEGAQPPTNTRIFPGVQATLAIALFVRTPGADHQAPATIHHTTLAGDQGKKFAALAALDLDAPNVWRQVRAAWQAPFTPTADTDWDDHPALGDLLPWTAPGIKPNRTWVYAPQREALTRRWNRLVGEDDVGTKRALFRESRDASLTHRRRPLAGTGTHQFTATFAEEDGPAPQPVRVGYRSFDRQWLIPDARLLHAPSPDLWAARGDGQVFLVELHSQLIPAGGPGVVFSALIPDMHHFKGSEGGRVLPLLHPDGDANLAPGLTAALGALLDAPAPTARDVAAYIAAITAHPAFTTTFLDELTTPGIRVPLTADPALWTRAVELGRQVIWAQTYGATYADPGAGRPADTVRLPATDSRRPLATAAVTVMPTTATYDEDAQVLHVGDGAWAPVRPEVWAYAVGGRAVVKSWIDYRRAEPAGRRSSPLDDINTTTWPLEWTRELTDLLTALTRLVDLEPAQGDLLADVLAGPVLSTEALSGAGVVWPTTRADRRPRHAQATAETEAALFD